ncbi:unnamed protein product [Mycena citricolor]|uniref:Polysaccharide lyase 14 domain-containing protein n=1 Tax=Mycena citricolor TaxID=2018698 RepID=A0AAD2K4F6_9AGAR|nr:unnamed protein product [Mycena citricolor]
MFPLALLIFLSLTASTLGNPIEVRKHTSTTKPHTTTTKGSASTKTSTAKTTQPTSGSGGSGSSGAPTLQALFPIAKTVSQWSTFPGASNSLALSDKTLGPISVMPGVTHDYVSAPDGTLAMQAVYPKGSFNPSGTPRGGFSFYAAGPSNVNLATAKEVTLGYSVFFPKGFQFNKGGKLPGLYGGDDAKTSLSCSGGRRDPTCFSARLMWRTNGAGELYTYLPDPSEGSQFAANQKLCKIPNSDCNPTYGDSISRGAFTFKTGAWTTVAERLKLNTPGQADGELELFVDGKSVINVAGLVIRDKAAGQIRGIQAQTFFGGATKDWASPLDQKAFFADFSMAVIS